MEELHSEARLPVAARVAGVGLGFATAHSLLASHAAKRLAARLLGPRRRYGLYRLGYVLWSVAACVWTARWLARQPDRDIYRVPPPWSWLVGAGQAGSVGLLAASIIYTGPLRASGLAQAACWLRGGNPAPEPEAQGPALGPDGRVLERGPFRYCRHPGDLAAIGVFALFPRMTRNRAVIAALAVLYSLLGALHEERRLRASYGAAYEDYRRRVPFLLPWPRPKRRLPL